MVKFMNEDGMYILVQQPHIVWLGSCQKLLDRVVKWVGGDLFHVHIYRC